MALSGRTWRPHPFIVGTKYVAKVSFDGLGLPESTFDKGVEYVLERIDHSHYDEATVFTFKRSGTDEVASWWWGDREPDSLCLERFSEIAPNNSLQGRRP